MSVHGDMVDRAVRELTEAGGHSRLAIHAAAQVIADVTGVTRPALADLIARSYGGSPFAPEAEAVLSWIGDDGEADPDAGPVALPPREARKAARNAEAALVRAVREWVDAVAAPRNAGGRKRNGRSGRRCGPGLHGAGTPNGAGWIVTAPNGPQPVPLDDWDRGFDAGWKAATDGRRRLGSRFRVGEYWDGWREGYRIGCDLDGQPERERVAL